MHKICSTLSRFRPLAPLVLRVVIGGLFVWHGIDKFDAGISMIENMFDMWGVPVPALTAPLVAIVEIVAGFALIIGMGTRIAAMLLGAVMIGSLLYVKIDLGIISEGPMPGAELDLSLLTGLVALVVLGPGFISADQALGIEPTERSPEVDPALAR